MKHKNPYIHLLATMRKYAPNKRFLFTMLAVSALAKIIWMSEPYVFGQVINAIQLEGKAGRTKIVWLLIMFTSITFFAWIFHGVSRVWEEKIKFQVAEAYTSDLFHTVASLPMAWHTDNHSGKTIDKISKATNALKEFSGQNFIYLHTIISALGSFISLSIIRRPAAIILTILSVLTVFIIQKFDIKLVKLLTERNTKEHDVMSGLFDFLSNIKTVITLRFEDRAGATIRQRIANVFPVFQSYAKLNERKWFSMDMLMSLSVFIIILMYIHHELSSTGLVLIGTLMMLWQYIGKMRSAFNNFTRQRGDLMQMSTNVHTIDEIIIAYNQLHPKSSIVSFDKHHPILIRGLTFSYQDAGKKKTTLQNISLDLIPGQRLALVGASGSGKSTLMMLLRGLYPVDTVSVSMGGETYDSLEPLSHHASLIPQDPEIFEQTIRYNITMGLDVDEETIAHYIRLARFDEVIPSLPNGLDTDIKERGVNLSGGQKQRLALARGLLMSASSRLLLLDESTSSVDVTNEKMIYENIFATHKETCIVASIHKLHLLPLFDHIVVLDTGRIIESGTFHDLTTDPHTHLAGLRKTYLDTVDT